MAVTVARAAPQTPHSRIMTMFKTTEMITV